MKYNAKCVAGVMSGILITWAVVEGVAKSPGKIEPHAEVEAIYGYPNSGMFTSVTASTTASGDVAFSAVPKMCLKWDKS